jgi:molecular chaperone DnaK
MRIRPSNLSAAFLLACVLTGAGPGCDSTGGTQTGAAGSAAGSGGAAGTGGAGGDSLGTGGSAAGATGAAGAGGVQTPQQIHDALLNAPTFGGLDVTRMPPTITYPTCQ